MVVGLVGAAAERDFRRVLSFNLVGHIGLTTIGIGLATPAALGGSILYLFHHMLVITDLFLISGLFLRLRRSTEFSALGGMYGRHRLAAALSIVPVFSLAGVPPLSGFMAKLAIVEAVFEADHYWMGATVLLVSLLTLLSMARLWDESFAKPAAPEADLAPLTPAMLAPVAVLTTLIVAVTFAAEPLVEVTRRAAEQLLEREPYVRAVLGGG
jgi:multicomponent Na+:H+ antiporter subunit D